MQLSDLVAHAEKCYDEYVADLAHLVGIDSGTADIAGVNAVADWCEAALRDRAWSVHRHAPEQPGGDTIVATRSGTGSARVLLLAHMDTVFPAGSAAARPFRVDGGRAYGPGVVDDKGCLLAGIAAVDALVATGAESYGELTYLLSADEETGSPTARRHIEAAASGVSAVLCLEAARASGALVSARKGIATIAITLRGRAAHAGVEPEKGISAALAAARLTEALHALNTLVSGGTVNVGRLNAGTRPNVVAADASLEVDVRAPDPDAFATLLGAVRVASATAFVDGTTSELVVTAQHAPLAKTAGGAQLCAMAAQIAADLGFDVEDVMTGGASDANIAAGAGVPVLDGLGPIGGDAHSVDEWLDLGSVVPRVTLLAGLIARLSATD